MTTLPNTPGRQAAQAKYNKKPIQKKRRAQRNAARRLMIRQGRVKKGDGKDVAHYDNNTKNNSMTNLLVQPPKKNRSFKRNKKGGHK